MEWSNLKQEIRHRFPGAPQITPGELADRLGEEPLLLLDARAPEEYAVSHLPGAVSAPDVESALEAIREASQDGRSGPVVVYCSVGWRSSNLVEQLRERGIDHVRNLEGSIFQWANEGRPVVRDDREVRQVHPFDKSWGRYLDPELRAFEPTPPATRPGDEDASATDTEAEGTGL